MIPGDELDRYRNADGDLPGPDALVRRVMREHPDWGLSQVCDYVTRLQITALRRQTDPKPAPSRRARVPLLADNPEGYVATVDGVKYYEYLQTTRPIELAGRELQGAPRLLVPRPYTGYRDGPECPWTILRPDEPFKDGAGGENWRKCGGALQREVDELRRLDRLDRSTEDLTALERIGATSKAWRRVRLARITINEIGRAHV